MGSKLGGSGSPIGSKRASKQASKEANKQAQRKSLQNPCEILPKPLQNHVFGGLWAPLGLLGASRRGVRASWGDLVMSWGGLGTSLGALGALLGRPWRRLVASCGVLGLSWDRLGSSRAAPVAFLGPLRLDFPPVLANWRTTKISKKPLVLCVFR